MVNSRCDSWSALYFARFSQRSIHLGYDKSNRLSLLVFLVYMRHAPTDKPRPPAHGWGAIGVFGSVPSGGPVRMASDNGPNPADWEYDVLQLAESGGVSLRHIAFTIFEEEGLVGKFGIPDERFKSLLQRLEDLYSVENPYHCALHAAVSVRVNVGKPGYPACPIKRRRPTTSHRFDLVSVQRNGSR